MDIIEKTMIETEENLQLAENEQVEDSEDLKDEYVQKRELLEKTKITKQTWSIVEIFQKIKDGKLIVDTDYQRNIIWDIDKKTAFIESLFMEIMIPPIYVVEIPGEDFLSENKYEVVDGKQRLSTITEFLRNELCLKGKSLEYYCDIFGGKSFLSIREQYSEKIQKMLSYVLDIYVITANSPESTKYDIFARLNKGAEKLKVNEIRRAIYHSNVTALIVDFVDKHIQDTALPELKSEYEEVFSKNDIKRFEDYGRFYRSIAFYLQSDIDNCIVVGYNSRPREMINTVLQKLQKKELNIESSIVNTILERTLILKKQITGPSNDYIIDSFIKFAILNWEKLLEEKDRIIADEEFAATLIKSAATTSNVNKRLEIISKYLR